jgi:hypothetical protein
VELHVVPRAQHLLLPNPLLGQAELAPVAVALAQRAEQQPAAARVAARRPLEVVAGAVECNSLRKPRPSDALIKR